MWQAPDFLFGRGVHDRQVVVGLAPLAVDIEMQFGVGTHGGFG